MPGYITMERDGYFRGAKDYSDYDRLPTLCDSE
jgi:hypothetical protein